MDGWTSKLTYNEPTLLAILLIGGTLAWVIIWKLREFLPRKLMEEWRDEALRVAQNDPAFEKTPSLKSELSTAEGFALSSAHRVVLAILSFALLILSILISQGPLDTIAKAMLLWSVLLIASIDIKHYLIPDVIVVPLLWAGLLFHILQNNDPTEFILGAAVGYLILYVLMHLVRTATGKTTIGNGDMKSLAMLGAWFGISDLPQLFAIAMLVVLVTSIIRSMWFGSGPTPTGPAYFVASIVGTLGISII